MTSQKLRNEAREYLSNMPYGMVKDIARGAFDEPEYVRNLASVEINKRDQYSSKIGSVYDYDMGIGEFKNARKMIGKRKVTTKKRTKLSLKCPRCRAKDSDNVYHGVWQCNVCGCEFGDGVGRRR